MFQRLLRWWLTVLGGILLGGGLVLHGQVAVAHEMRGHVENTCFLWRAIGELTFVYQDDLTRSALLMRDLPEEVLTHSDLMAGLLMALGALSALGAMFIDRSGRKRRK